MVYGERISSARVSRQYDIPELAEKLGIPRCDLARMEQGRMEVPKEVLFKLSQILNYPNSFFEKEPAAKPAMSAVFF